MANPYHQLGGAGKRGEGLWDRLLRKRRCMVQSEEYLETMTKTATFRLLVIIFICFLPIIIVATVLETSLSLLPPELEEWEDRDLEAPMGAVQVIIILALLVAVIASLTGLLMLKKWGAWTFLAATVVAEVSSIFYGPYVSSGLLYACEDTSSILAGVILGMAFFSDVLAPAPADSSP